ncbi:hypothetical protein [Prevotella histicola]|uniref:hypothetical protein n=1 Tax=Prevotella histicola TaxID=470565 RepID=UPI0028EF16E5|nr:hypothetical protein [Prevotella histicola]
MKPTAIQSLPHFSQQDISPEVTRLKKENSIAAYPKHPINDAVLPAIATATTPTSHRPDEAQLHRTAMNKEQKKIKR